MTPDPTTADVTERDFAARFAAELDRLAEGRLGQSQVGRLATLSRDQLLRGVRSRLSWLSPDSVELLSRHGPEEFARAVVREQVREHGNTGDLGTLMLADALFQFPISVGP